MKRNVARNLMKEYPAYDFSLFGPEMTFKTGISHYAWAAVALTTGFLDLVVFAGLLLPKEP